MTYDRQGPDSIKRCNLTSIGNPIVEIRRSYDRLISTMGFPIPVRRHLYIESGPWSLQQVWERENTFIVFRIHQPCHWAVWRNVYVLMSVFDILFIMYFPKFEKSVYFHMQNYFLVPEWTLFPFLYVYFHIKKQLSIWTNYFCVLCTSVSMVPTLLYKCARNFMSAPHFRFGNFF